MKSAPALARSQELELKLALPATDPACLAGQLARVPALKRLRASVQHLHNVYYDTPEQYLRGQRVALRIRRLGSAAQPQWLQTLKTGGAGDSALSQRGEWEVPLNDATLSLAALQATPWPGIDPDGTVFAALAPCFATDFERSSWQLRRRDGSVIEVALDLGQIVAGDQRAPICELELELRAGTPAALFRLARQIARGLALLPAEQSKAERGYALAQGRLQEARRAQPPLLTPDLDARQAAQRVLREMWAQFTANLNALHGSDDPELVHQARVGWRRFKSGLRLFRPLLAASAPPAWQALQALLDRLGAQRDLDVARTETLPPLAPAYIDGDPRRERHWQALSQALSDAAARERAALLRALRQPPVGACLLAGTQWLEELSSAGAPDEKLPPLRPWARDRIRRLRARLRKAGQQADAPEARHRLRILAKRLRYGIEALRPLLPARRAQADYQEALQLQTDIGASRDLLQAMAVARRLRAAPDLLAFLRGVALGRQAP